MTASVKRCLLIAAAFFVIAALRILCMPLTASAADGSGAYGAVFPDYNSAKEVNVTDDCDADPSGEKDSAGAIQKALNVGRDEASDSNRVVVFVPEGVYKISRTLSIYSNTQLILDPKAKIIKDFDYGCMIKNTMHDSSSGGYDGDRNILIEGGTWDGNTKEYNAVSTFSNIRLAHAHDVVVRNVTVLNNKNGHHIEAGGIRGLTIEGCYFSGFTGTLKKEAIQLDVMNCEELFVDYPPFDDTPCDNVIIRNCTFRDIPRGIGSHSAAVGVYYTNITIMNNTFDNISDICLVLYNYKKCTVSGNSMNRCGAGMTFNYMSDESFRHYFKPTIGLEEAKQHIDPNADTVIENNTISTIKTAYRTEPFAIKIYGADTTGTDDYPSFNYKVGNIRINSNDITTPHRAVWINNGYSVSVRNNVFKTAEDPTEADLALISWSSSIGFKNNTLSSAVRSGLRAENVSSITVSGNSFQDCTENVSLVSTSDSTIKENSISGGKNGVALSGGCSDIKCTGNVIKQFDGSAVYVTGSGSGKDIKVRSNDISEGNIGISCESGGKCLASGNSFEAVQDKVYADSDGLVTLSAVKGFYAEETTENMIKLTWNAVSEADGINIYRRDAGAQDFEFIAALDSGAVFSDEKLYSGTNYFYRIVPFIAVNGENYENTPSDDIRTRTKLNIETAYISCVSQAGFTGRPITPKVTVVANSRRLVEGVDYDVSYSSNVFIGSAAVTVTGKGIYSGKLVHNFDITLSDTKVYDAVSRSRTKSPMYSVSPKKLYEVTAAMPVKTAYADSGISLPSARRTITALTLGTPTMTVRSTDIWDGSGFERF